MLFSFRYYLSLLTLLLSTSLQAMEEKPENINSALFSITPSEVVCHIAYFLPIDGVCALSQASKKFNDDLNPEAPIWHVWKRRTRLERYLFASTPVLTPHHEPHIFSQTVSTKDLVRQHLLRVRVNQESNLEKIMELNTRYRLSDSYTPRITFSSVLFDAFSRPSIEMLYRKYAILGKASALNHYRLRLSPERIMFLKRLASSGILQDKIACLLRYPDYQSIEREARVFLYAEENTQGFQNEYNKMKEEKNKYIIKEKMGFLVGDRPEEFPLSLLTGASPDEIPFLTFPSSTNTPNERVRELNEHFLTQGGAIGRLALVQKIKCLGQKGNLYKEYGYEKNPEVAKSLIMENLEKPEIYQLYLRGLATGEFGITQDEHQWNQEQEALLGHENFKIRKQAQLRKFMGYVKCDFGYRHSLKDLSRYKGNFNEAFSFIGELTKKDDHFGFMTALYLIRGNDYQNGGGSLQITLTGGADDHYIFTPFLLTCTEQKCLEEAKKYIVRWASSGSLIAQIYMAHGLKYGLFGFMQNEEKANIFIKKYYLSY
jgi:hypothetical protein